MGPPRGGPVRAPRVVCWAPDGRLAGGGPQPGGGASVATMTRVGLLAATDLPSGWTAPAPALAFHAVVAVVAVVVLALPWPALGVRITVIVLAYHLGMLLVVRTVGGPGWGRAWLVLAPLSVLKVAPGWFLSAELGTLSFPDTGAPFVGTVPVFMAGMWVMALFPLVLVAGRLEGRFGARAGLAGSAIAGALLAGTRRRHRDQGRAASHPPMCRPPAAPLREDWGLDHPSADEVAAGSRPDRIEQRVGLVLKACRTH